MAGATHPGRDRPRWAALLQHLDRWSLRLVLVALVVSYLALFHVFLRAGQHAPYLAVDDSLGNVAVVLSNLHRYGFLASPVQALGALRLHGFYNYGPWPFLFGAVLDWVFGTSYLVQRAIHPLGLLVLSAAVFWSLRRSSAAAAGCFSLLVVWLFWVAQWPEVRPGITVAVFAGFAIVLLGRAMRNGRYGDWFGAGFCAASAAATHQVAWALVPATALVWLLSRWVTPGISGPRERLHSFAAMTAGGAVSALIYLFAIRFRVMDLLHLMLGYAHWAHSHAQGGYLHVLKGHFLLAWNAASLGHPVPWLLLALALFFAVFLVALRMSDASVRGLMLCLMVPPAVFAAAYQLSLGVYNNVFIGYELVSQVTTVWAVVAALAAGMLALARLRPLLGRNVEVGLRFAVVVALGVLTQFTVAAPRGWAAPSTRQVNFNSYMAHVIGILPARAHVLGSVIFGLGSGVRLDLVQFDDGLAMAARFRPAARVRLAPGFLLLNDVLQLETYRRIRHRGQPPIAAFLSEFPGQDYHVVGITYAPPYGTTEVYARQDGGSAVGGFPAVAFNDGRHPSWAERIGPPVDVRWTTAPAVRFDLHYIGRLAMGNADASIRGDLPAGLYLIGVKVKTDTHQGGLLIGTNAVEYSGSAGDIGFDLAQAVYFRSGDVAYLLVDHHQGGNLYLSQFDADPSATMRVVGVHRVLSEETMGWERIPMPALSGWRAEGRGVSVAGAGPDGAVLVRGNRTPFGYQLGSPAIRVRPGETYRIHVPIRVRAGAVAVGVLNASRTKWLRAPIGAATDVEFGAKGNREVYVVICNYERSVRGEPSRFEVGPASLYRVGANEQYADQLAACTGVPARRRPETCQ